MADQDAPSLDALNGAPTPIMGMTLHLREPEMLWVCGRAKRCGDMPPAEFVRALVKAHFMGEIEQGLVRPFPPESKKKRWRLQFKEEEKPRLIVLPGEEGL